MKSSGKVFALKVLNKWEMLKRQQVHIMELVALPTYISCAIQGGLTSSDIGWARLRLTIVNKCSTNLYTTLCACSISEVDG